MIRSLRYLTLLVCVLLCQSIHCLAETKALYQFYSPSHEGTGKVYMGREIAPVMGYQGAAWLERETREQEERTDVLLTSLNLKNGMTIADVGAGTGYLSRRIANSIGPNSIVYAIDVQTEMIAKLRSLAKIYPTIKPILSDAHNVNLPENSLDMAVMVDVYHELASPYEVIQSIVTALKPNGRLVLVEYRAEDDRVPIKQIHKMREDQIIKELSIHAVKWQKTLEILPWQHVVVFVKN